MPRTTVNIEASILKELKTLQKKEHHSLGQIVSQLLAEALHRRKTPSKAPAFKWISRSMNALVDLSDKEALHAALDRNEK